MAAGCGRRGTAQRAVRRAGLRGFGDRRRANPGTSAAAGEARCQTAPWSCSATGLRCRSRRGAPGSIRAPARHRSRPSGCRDTRSRSRDRHPRSPAGRRPRHGRSCAVRASAASGARRAGTPSPSGCRRPGSPKAAVRASVHTRSVLDGCLGQESQSVDIRNARREQAGQRFGGADAVGGRDLGRLDRRVVERDETVLGGECERAAHRQAPLDDGVLGRRSGRSRAPRRSPRPGAAPPSRRPCRSLPRATRSRSEGPAERRSAAWNHWPGVWPVTRRMTSPTSQP